MSLLLKQVGRELAIKNFQGFQFYFRRLFVMESRKKFLIFRTLSNSLWKWLIPGSPVMVLLFRSVNWLIQCKYQKKDGWCFGYLSCFIFRSSVKILKRPVCKWLPGLSQCKNTQTRVHSERSLENFTINFCRMIKLSLSCALFKLE